MLLILMHNNKDYLEYLSQLALREGIKDSTFVSKKGIGIRLLGGDATFVFSRGSSVEAYDKAFVAIVKSEEETKHFLDVIEGDDYLERLNMQDKGFVCVIPFHYVKSLESESLSKSRKTEVKITNFLKKERIRLNLRASCKEEAIKEMTALLGNAIEISNFELFLKDVFKRESLKATGIVNGIAIPHARTQAVKEFVIAVGRSYDGVDFGALDNRPAKLIFLIGTPKDKGVNTYLRILAHLTRLLQKEDFKNGLLCASSPEEIIEQFRKVESLSSYEKVPMLC
ncbi:MAG: PTS sugar transporter subunit IIA [Deltaproteobacteria bacterium]|nr:PTS sugar transporter subunit IIA [Deltaproteobacteria bacterium]